MPEEKTLPPGQAAGRMPGDGVARILLLTAVAMVAFATNSVLCRLALAQTAIDPAIFTVVRIVSGALTLWILCLSVGRGHRIGGSWRGALALLAYAACFSFAYVSLDAGTGALLLFAAVQATMILWGLWRGERLAAIQWSGLAAALAGLVVLLAPGITAPEPAGATLMVAAGIAWGIYSLLGRGSSDPLGATAGNFLRATPPAVLLALATLGSAGWDAAGLVYAVLSGALSSGLGYAVWYTALPGLTATRAASVQLSVPVIAALGGALLLAEPVTLRLALASAAVLGGIALVLRRRPARS
jgi:drug/metabolite transporter (DMT)-like permease